ncbi:MAG: PQ-loop domain-containing transporter [Mycoplasmoidaceae bacterium]
MVTTQAIVAAVIGWIILGLVGSYSIPQFVKIIKTKNTSSLSIVSYTAFVISNSLMASWGIGNAVKSLYVYNLPIHLVYLTLAPNILSNLLNVTINLTSLITKIKHVKLAKKYGITEIQLAAKLLKAKKGGK